VEEPDQPVGLLPPRRQEDHRRARPRPLLQAAHHLDPVEAGQHQVEDDEVGPVQLGEPQRLGPVTGLPGLVTGPLDVAGDDLDDRRLVVDDEDGAAALLCHLGDLRASRR